MPSTHFTAVVEISKTTHAPATTSRYGHEEIPASRDVEEIARVVVRADRLGLLVDKARSHLSLVADEEV